MFSKIRKFRWEFVKKYCIKTKKLCKPQKSQKSNCSLIGEISTQSEKSKIFKVLFSKIVVFFQLGKCDDVGDFLAKISSLDFLDTFVSRQKYRINGRKF